MSGVTKWDKMSKVKNEWSQWAERLGGRVWREN